MAQNVNDIVNGGGAMYSSEGRPLESGSGMEGSKALKKGPWTAMEDQVLTEYVRKQGEGNWNSVQRNSGLNRYGKSCRLRWVNHLRPNLKKGAFTPEEERLILELHAKYGNKWARMASQLPGRTDNEIKNYWNTRVKRRQRQGLPLYPHDIKQSQQQSHSHSQQTASLTQATATTTMPPTTQPLCFQYPTSSLSQIHQLPSIGAPTPPHHSLPVFDPTTTTTITSSFTFHRPDPILGSSLCYNRYPDILGYSPPLSPTSQRSGSIFRTSFMPDISSSHHFSPGNISMPDMSSFQFQPLDNYNGTSSKFNFGDSLFSSRTRSPYLVKSELPSSQVLQTKVVPSGQVSQTQQSSQSDQIINNTNKVNVAVAANEIHCTNGLLEKLLQETEAFASNTNPRKAAIGQLGYFEEKHVLDQLDGYGRWLASSSTDTSLSEVKPIHDHGNGFINSVPEDLSKLFSFIPSTEPISDWYSTDSSGELSNGGQSSGVTETSLEFDMQQQMASFFPAASSTDHDRVSNNWDNLSGICSSRII